MYAAEDQKKREFSETKNQADTLLYTAERTMRELGDKVNASDKKEIEEKVNALRSELEKQDKAELTGAIEALSQVLQRVGAAMYKQTEQSQPKTSSENGSDDKKDEEKSQEGEFEKK